jgi:hypothetical protein
MKKTDGSNENFEEIQILIWDEDNEQNQFLKVRLKNPHQYSQTQDISWKNDFEPYLKNVSLDREIDDGWISWKS